MNGIGTGGMQWLLELVLVGLLALTLVHALRLERALGVLKRDRSALEALVADFNASTLAAEQGVERLHDAAEGAGRQLARQMESAARLRDDLAFLAERGETLADRLDRLVRTGRALEQAAPEPRLGEPRLPEPPAAPEPDSAEPSAPRVRSQAERDLLRALRLAR